MFEDLSNKYYRLGLSLALENRISSAIEVLEKAVVFDQSNWKAWNVLGLCRYRLGDFDKARKAWQKSLIINPETNPAVRYLNDMESDEFKSLQKQYHLALKLALSGKYSQAIRIINGNKFLGSSFVYPLNLLGLCLYGRGKFRRARSKWEMALSLDQDNPCSTRYVAESVRISNKKGFLVDWWEKFLNKR
ncbi:tetratricopeptide (TPR) repeat protein [Caldicoprobacter guelmensis]|uniref:tetratricopeptide repeat protein n=1 Tax=Caldicoprobacter guelmensis TaxID=1170224 RepID=UPI00195A1A1F|nr:tetratricopeptide repeat protein [Caldicoprobacter guelmensis]MBM7583195.1 tetratricopeptide (TPR) repeat protein [Caldicoprobacter guelmensis]